MRRDLDRFHMQIEIDHLLGEVIDQSLFDYKIDPSTGSQPAGVMAISVKEKDIFLINLKTVLDDLRGGSFRQVRPECMNSDHITIEVFVPFGSSRDLIASRIKDMLKYGMLAWWNSNKSPTLYQAYQLKHENAFSKLKMELAGKTRRPYSYY